MERLEQHAESLAAAQLVAHRPPRVLSLHKRLEDNAVALLAAYRASAAELESGQVVVPAAEWLLDNYHLVEEQVREVRDDLPPGFYRQLPKLATGPLAGYPRVFGLTWAFVAHTDSNFDPYILRRFIAAYQRVQPLDIGELWAVAITLRIVLIENLRRLADEIGAGQKSRADAEALASRLVGAKSIEFALETDIATRAAGPLSEAFAVHLVKRLRDQDPRTTPALGWLEQRLGQQGTSIEEMVLQAQQRQGASNVTVRNIITSMRLISAIDWAELFEKVSLVDKRLCEASAFAAMDFPTRNLYRSAIEQLARGSALSELEVADCALAAASVAATQTADARLALRVGDPGYHLIADGRPALERSIGFRAPVLLRISRINIRLGIRGYVGSILFTIALLIGLALSVLGFYGLGEAWLLLFAVVAFFPVSELATALVNRAISSTFNATALPALDMKAGVPPGLRTLVAVPTLLSSEADLLEQIERLAVHYLGGASGELAFALLLDGLDADQEVMPGDAPLLAVAAAAIQELNQRYGPGPGGDRFLLLYRRRVFNAGENIWMGWERKRGKLHELNRLLRGAVDTTYIPIGQAGLQVPANVHFVITLDADTRLPRDAAQRLIGKMAHPLNQPQFDAMQQRVTNGYAILQPRVTPALPVGCEGSVYQKVFSSPGGMDPYAATISDVYQDLFGEGSYTGKGIYDVDAFEAALAGRVPDNAMLSHDLFEGIFARAGLASDVEVVEEFPSRYDVAARRQHRWTRGDWQLLPWLLGRTAKGQALPSVGRGKMLDNLRRSLFAPCSLVALGCSWLMPMPASALATLFILGCILIPAFLPCFFSLLPRRSGISMQSRIDTLLADLRQAGMQAFLGIAFLGDQAWNMGDAIVRTLTRLFITRRHLLEWATAAQLSGSPQLGLRGCYESMAGGTLLALAVAVGAVLVRPESWPLALPLALLWLAAPALALWASQPQRQYQAGRLSASDAEELRLTARKTWRFFETFVTAADNYLPPDNYQENPRPILARRTSPTNIGLYLLSAVAARDFGWAGTVQTVERLEATLATMNGLARFKGHYFNWYGTEDLRPLEPPYVSSVDSGNLAGHLITVAQACEEWASQLSSPDIRPGLQDNFRQARKSIVMLLGLGNERGRQLDALLEEIGTRLEDTRPVQLPLRSLGRLVGKAAEALRGLVPSVADEGSIDALFWIDAMGDLIAQHERDRQAIDQVSSDLTTRLGAVANTARAMALAMDFSFLLVPDRQLLSVGYSLEDNSLDPSCYDLLASEARLASLFAIAKGDAPTRHWWRLGRTATPLGHGAALISWSGSMFEYLMPALVMRAPYGSLLDQTNRLVVERQQSYGRSLNIPWGMSESAYNARDMEFTYQYSNFGVPGLGLKRGLSENRVIAPYATGLAAMIDPAGAQQNFKRLAHMGALGRYGFYEALDFTAARLPGDSNVAIVHNFMAHHQGMTIVAIANALQGGRMRDRFHREAMIQACELLLQERMPRMVAVAHPRAEEVNVSAIMARDSALVVRRLKGLSSGAPVTHLLSNGRYTVMVTAAGAGYSRWRDMAVTRWQEDSTTDHYGTFVFLRDMQNGHVWSAGMQPIGGASDHDEVVFSEDYAEFMRRDGSLASTMDVLVSGEDDGEVRRVSLANSGWRAREIELTSYAEIVLATPAADNAHPAFAKMFVVTEHLDEFSALIATRRTRSDNEPQIWAAHFAVVQGESVTEPQYESDRARFIGRGNTVGTASALVDGQPLSNTVGTVLDPIFSVRYRLLIAPGTVARVAFWTIVAASRDELIDLIDKHHDRSAYDRAKTLAWTQAQVQLRHFAIETEEAADFQRLAAPILYSDPHFRAPSETMIRGAGPQSALWPQAISGDLPIVLLRINDMEDIAQVRQLLRAHEYWRMKRLAVDLVILNERASSYIQDLQAAIEAAVRSSQSVPRFRGEAALGAVYALRADLMGLDTRALLQSVARVTLRAQAGSIAEQLARVAQKPLAPDAVHHQAVLPLAPPSSVHEELEFFNGLGGFDKGGREYVVVLNDAQCTPMPWINVIANPGFGFQVSAEGSGYTWAQNSRENQLTPWSNDPIQDPAGEVIYVHDEATGELWTPTALPIRDSGTYIARHGPGYSRHEHNASDIMLKLLQYVPLADPIKISRLKLRNLSDLPRQLSITAYAEWVLGTSRGASGPFIITKMDETTGAMLAYKPWNTAFPGRVAFSDLGGRQSTWTADRSEFIGRYGNLAAPAGLVGGTPLSGVTGAGLDPCSALQCMVMLEPGEEVELVWFLGQCGSEDDARALITRYRNEDLDAVLEQVVGQWNRVLGAVQVKTPDRAMDIMLNGWLLYQTLACRIWARSAFYQASGAYGFRDQLQDGMALAFAAPELAREHLLRAAGRQFIEGDVQHWWLPHSGQGVRTRISDDRVWMAYAAAIYIEQTGDVAVLDEQRPFLEGQLLAPGEHDAFFQPMQAEESASLYEHCARGLDQSIAMSGEQGLPLMGGGDWNDGMNRVGEGGKGESVWLGWLLLKAIALFAPLAYSREPDRAQRWRAHATALQAAIERVAWDGQWYRRATFDNGSWIGAKDSLECRIDSIAQSWAVLSDAADPVRAAMAMAALDQHLIRRDDGVALLFIPPFDKISQDPGYIKGYPPGLRENGGQYSHAAMWAIWAFARLDQGDKAAELFAMLNPINHTRTPDAVERYKAEPYVIAADVYSLAPHAGRAGWSWYTGSAAWMYRAGVEGILGIRWEGAMLVIEPRLPQAWPGFEASVRLGPASYVVLVDNSAGSGAGDTRATLDGQRIDCSSGCVRVPVIEGEHRLLISL